VIRLTAGTVIVLITGVIILKSKQYPDNNYAKRKSENIYPFFSSECFCTNWK
jgi:hypothetical protein